MHHLLDFLRYNVSAYTVEYFVRARRRFLFAKLNTLITETSQASASCCLCMKYFGFVPMTPSPFLAALKKPSSSQPTTVVHVNPAEDDEAIQSLKEAPVWLNYHCPFELLMSLSFLGGPSGRRKHLECSPS